MVISEFSPMLYFQGFGLTVVDTCFVKDGTTSYWFALIPIFLNVPINLVCFLILKCSTGYNRNKALQKMVRACLSMCICWGYPIFTTGMKNTMNKNIEKMDDVAFIVGSSAGTVLAVCRLGSFEIFRRLWRVTFLNTIQKEKRVSKGLGSVLVEDCSVNVFFQELTDETVRDILLNLSMTFLPTSKSEEKFSYSYRKLKYNFRIQDYQKLDDLIETSTLRLKNDGIWEYGQDYFKKIRKSSKISNEDLLKSICMIQNFQFTTNQNTGGRSGAFLIQTVDEKFVLKMVNRHERYLLLDILPSYTERVCLCTESKIVRILGMFKVTSSKHSFIVMENVVKDKKNAVVFDLKGSVDDRYVRAGEGSVLKDGNFLEMQKKVKLFQEQREELMMIIADDLRFFTRHNIIDYSVLLAVYFEDTENDSRYFLSGTDQTYAFGIIDFLQEYSLKKKIELVVKRIKGKVNTSVCSSVKYSRRFFSFIAQEFIEGERFSTKNSLEIEDD